MHLVVIIKLNNTNGSNYLPDDTERIKLERWKSSALADDACRAQGP